MHSISHGNLYAFTATSLNLYQVQEVLIVWMVHQNYSGYRLFGLKKKKKCSIVLFTFIMALETVLQWTEGRSEKQFQT